MAPIVRSRSMTSFQDLPSPSSGSIHGDPKGDSLLESSEGESLCVHSYVLKTYSDLFREMYPLLSAPPHKPHDQDQDRGRPRITLPASSETIQTLLSFMLDRHPQPLLEPPYEELFDLLSHLQTDEILRDRVLFYARQQTQKAPWRTFCLASKVDDPKLAVLALESMRLSKEGWAANLTLHNFPAEPAEKLTNKYLLALMKALSPFGPAGIDNEGVRELKEGAEWYVVARRFRVE